MNDEWQRLADAVDELRRVTVQHALRDGVWAFALRYFGVAFVVSGIASLILTHDRIIEILAGISVVALGALLLVTARVVR